ncbi:MAG TPA: hypothetical protein VFO34_15170 [Candidatus Acidoferrales bacterium]|nr:hypothetical protein [Candidatus Acidoferrales bacterium]
MTTHSSVTSDLSGGPVHPSQDLGHRIDALEKHAARSKRYWWLKGANFALMLSVLSLGLTLWHQYVEDVQQRLERAQQLGVEIADTRREQQATQAEHQRAGNSDNSDILALNSKRTILLAELTDLIKQIHGTVPASMLLMLAYEKQFDGDLLAAEQFVREATNSKLIDAGTLASSHIELANILTAEGRDADISEEYRRALEAWKGHQDDIGAYNRANVAVFWGQNEIYRNHITNGLARFEDAEKELTSIANSTLRDTYANQVKLARSNALWNAPQGQGLIESLEGQWIATSPSGTIGSVQFLRNALAAGIICKFTQAATSATNFFDIPTGVSQLNNVDPPDMRISLVLASNAPTVGTVTGTMPTVASTWAVMELQFAGGIAKGTIKITPATQLVPITLTRSITSP